MKHYDCIVVGGGLAGLTCALELTYEGKHVALLEAKDYIGGRTASWNEYGMHVESGFHRYIGYYSKMPKMLHKAGIDLNKIVTWEEQVEIRVPDQEKSVVMGVSPLFGPLKMVRGIIANHPSLTLKDKLSLLSFFIYGFKDYLLNPSKLDLVSVKQYAHLYDVSEDAINHLLIPLSAGIFFLPPQRYSAYVFFGLFAPGIPKFYKMRIGAFLGGMSEVMCNPIADRIKQLGGEIYLGEPVQSLLLSASKDRVLGIKTSKGEEIHTDDVVWATSVDIAKTVLENDFANEGWFGKLKNLKMMDASTFQIELTSPVLPKDITTFGPNTCLGSFSEQSRTTFQGSKGRLSIILTPPEKFIEMSAEQTLEYVLHDLHRLNIDINMDQVLDYRKIDHPNDFYSLAPGNEQYRPDQKTSVKGLILAGDYTRQPYFATMEGAVASGINAAKLVSNKT
ncbi:FAD-dependent oxidoreductase [Alkalihalobacillus sp. AL-G]|uniref:hydroxysqualene dehydroxylase n=1 Tax=Alkalihalobacillus sp. AL-G TaxID=2926399 RepID=UPI00272C70F5|nr:FAD-dependent oxidoreductase [Alkalihalobacillus sp. AL-G]WLD91647.1 FAD-dependent oxidoreductase [Alkalihalobacillus sp. AL-G]